MMGITKTAISQDGLVGTPYDDDFGPVSWKFLDKDRDVAFPADKNEHEVTNDEWYQVKDYFVAAKLYTSKKSAGQDEPTGTRYMILFSKEEGKPFGCFVINRTADDVLAMTSMLQRAFKQRRKIYYSCKHDILSYTTRMDLWPSTDETDDAGPFDP